MKKFANLLVLSFLIGRLRDDANLRYLYQGEPTSKTGRPQKYDGKVDHNNIDMKHFKLVSKDEHAVVHSAIVHSISLKRSIKVVHALYCNEKGKQVYKLCFSTDINMHASDILKSYQSRFQIASLYREAKQHIGLNDCQTRSENKLGFHFNASLTAINLAKVTHWLSIPKEHRRSFSMMDVKIINHNALQLDLFFDKLGINPHWPKNIK
ncbi:hypothetical protein [Plebeiibacterium marinum]|uniref:Transposase n=1 Tax=Plebeiibacterium marinum TaxID=2992111 RepID=A0AAE3SLX6_9BACT|nr:hypothetical protein [Plebeiobacterium marinum]MCW3806965.1 hypothetical protein [Plebeiobacterium marinum]